jgi:hypothetical protein
MFNFPCRWTDPLYSRKVDSSGLDIFRMVCDVSYFMPFSSFRNIWSWNEARIMHVLNEHFVGLFNIEKTH